MKKYLPWFVHEIKVPFMCILNLKFRQTGKSNLPTSYIALSIVILSKNSVCLQKKPLGLIDYRLMRLNYFFVSSNFRIMKKLNNIVSPFIMLLIPLFLLIGILATTMNKELPADRLSAGLRLQIPSIKMIILAAIK